MKTALMKTSSTVFGLEKLKRIICEKWQNIASQICARQV